MDLDASILGAFLMACSPKLPSRNQPLALVFLTSLLLPLLRPQPAAATLVFQASQEGPNVIIRGTGSANLHDLNLQETKNDWSNILSSTEIYAGPAANGDGFVSIWSGLSGGRPTISSIGDLFQFPDSDRNSGDLLGFFITPGATAPSLVLPQNYTSNGRLDGTSVFSNLNLSELGLTSGTTTWTWGTGNNADSLELRVEASVPVPSPLPIAGAAVAFRWSRRLRRRLKSYSRASKRPR